ncbi:MAG: polysaccharide biosynthesis/export family protein [Deltaproteobacteria bacterium]|nr:polysaccharide biosynthesis/export family protein [Deltaproteobacteria bacterium]
MRRALLLAFALAGMTACPTTLPHYNYGAEPDPRRKEFVVGAGDELTVSVWKNPDLSTNMRVRLDGTVSMPLIGDVKAAGRTVAELREEITERLVPYLKETSAVVTVSVGEIHSYSFTVMGNVDRPGMFNPRRYVTIMEALGMAGDVNRFAAAERIVIVRKKPGGKAVRIPIDYRAIASGRRPDQDLVLVSGDVVYVP